MKLRNCILIFGLVWYQNLKEIIGAPAATFQPSPLDSSDKAAISYLKREAALEKQGSGAASADFFHHIKKSIGNTIKSKIGQLAKSSAGASAYFSHSSSGQHGHGHGYGHGYGPAIGYAPVHVPHYVQPHYYPTYAEDDHHYAHKPFDFWTLKKSVLYTLLQAVKAIKGGVIAIKGQLIKGGGHLLTAKGKLIRGGGEALTTIGKNIAASAFMWVPESHDSHEHDHSVEHHEGHHYDHASFSAPSGPAISGASGPGGPSAHYGVPSGLGSGPPTGGGGYYQHNSVVQDGKPQPVHDGLIILKKIPQAADNDVEHTHAGRNPDYQTVYDHDHHPHDAQVAQESQKTPSFQPLSDGIVPKMKTFMTSVIHASGDSEPEKTVDHSFKLNAIRSHTQKAALQSLKGGALKGYLDYIREQNKKPPVANMLLKQNGKTGQQSNLMFVTPTPAEGTNIKHNANPDVSHEALKVQTASLEQHLQQLQELQQLQDLKNVYQEQSPVSLGVQGVEYDSAAPLFIDLPANMDLTSFLNQYQVQSVNQPPQTAQQIPDLQTDADTSTSPFIIHYPDYESVLSSIDTQGKLEPRAATRKRHTNRHVSLSAKQTKPRRLTQLQQIQEMQRQLLREVPKANAPPHSRPTKAPNVDMVRSIEFLH